VKDQIKLNKFMKGKHKEPKPLSKSNLPLTNPM